jgi:tRNA dimethylallyltransferase
MLAEPFQNAYVLTGPTGSGKTARSIEMATELGAEIISMDSMTLYRGMDIGTAKPSAAEQRQVPHHLLDVLDPWESASVAWWRKRAMAIARDIEARGKRVLLVGGTPLYLKSVMYGLFPGPPANQAIRARLSQDAAREGPEALHRQLSRVDAQAALRLHPRDLGRIIRALEVHEITGRPISEWQQEWSRASRAPADGRIICLDPPRERLYEHINRRVDAMIAAGFIDEVRWLMQRGRPMSREASQALGYKEISTYLDGKASLDEAIEQTKTRSRNFAKRQLTWFRHLPGVHFVDPDLTFAGWRMTIHSTLV